MSTTTNLSTLKINYLTQAQYDAAAAGGLIQNDELYLTPETNSYVASTTTTQIFVQSSAPTSGMVAGDIWIDTSELS